MALKLQFGEIPGRGRTDVTVAPTITDNRGNGAALNKLPASALLMELSCYIKKMSIRTAVHWTPREGNNEADRLANGVLDGFDPMLRIPVNARSLQWEILPHAPIAGQAAEERFEGAKRRGQLPDRSAKHRKRKVSERLKMTDPW